ncbi:hypothetical protein ZWY2020_049696 [Hordeum vulgare]|nr:hypothetical protein ZWY2020_049696 [Hordeum vulgare]
MPTIIIKVDLDCGRCHGKMRKVLDRIREKGEFVIDEIKYDEKKNQVTVSGPFDADKLADKLCCKACNIIKEIEIVEPPPKKEEIKPPPPKEKAKSPGPAKDEKVKVEGPAKEKQPPAKVVEVPVPYPCPYPYPFPSGCCCHHQGHGGCQCPPPAPAPQPMYPCGGYMMVCEDDPSGACAIM